MNIKSVRTALKELDGKTVWLVTSITQYNFVSELVVCKPQSTDSIYFCSIVNGALEWAFYEAGTDNYLPMQQYCSGEVKEPHYQKRKFFTDGSIVAELSYFTLKYNNISIDDMGIFTDGWSNLKPMSESNLSISLKETEKNYLLRGYIDSCISKDFILSICSEQKIKPFVFDPKNTTVDYWKKFFMDTFLFSHSVFHEINMDWSTEFPPVNHLSLCFVKETFCGMGLAYVSSRKGDDYITIKVGYPGHVLSYNDLSRESVYFAKGVLTTKVFRDL